MLLPWQIQCHSGSHGANVLTMWQVRCYCQNYQSFIANWQKTSIDLYADIFTIAAAIAMTFTRNKSAPVLCRRESETRTVATRLLLVQQDRFVSIVFIAQLCFVNRSRCLGSSCWCVRRPCSIMASFLAWRGWWTYNWAPRVSVSSRLSTTQSRWGDESFRLRSHCR